MIEPNRQGEVWVFAEQEDGSLHDVVSGTLRQGPRIGRSTWSVKTGAILAGSNVGHWPAN